jgi:hypothetical protein
MLGGLTDLALALFHAIAAPRNHRCGHHGGRRHRRPTVAPAPQQPLSPLAVSHRRVLERPPSPSPDRLAYRPMEPSDPDASPWGRRGQPCSIHGWGSCPYQVAPVHEPLSTGHGGGGEEEEEDDERRITVVISLVGAPTICRMARISIDPRGRPQGLLVPRATTTPPTSPTPSLPAPPPPPGLSSLEAGPSGFVTPLDLLSPCGNRVLRRFTCFTTPSDKGRVPGSWDSTARPSH